VLAVRDPRRDRLVADPFQRHPGCRCTAAPITGEGKTLTRSRYHVAGRVLREPDPAEQDRVFTKAGAEAIRAGADPVSVVSARRGARGIDYSSAVLSGKTLPHSGRRLSAPSSGTPRRDPDPRLRHRRGHDRRAASSGSGSAPGAGRTRRGAHCGASG
jgi:hypothetical protein